MSPRTVWFTDMLRGGRARERQWAERRIENILKAAAAEQPPAVG